MPNQDDNCKDIVKPVVDNTAQECCEITPSNCVNVSEAIPFVRSSRGESLTSVLQKIALRLKNVFLTSVSTITSSNVGPTLFTYRTGQTGVNDQEVRLPVMLFGKVTFTYLEGGIVTTVSAEACGGNITFKDSLGADITDQTIITNINTAISNCNITFV